MRAKNHDYAGASGDTPFANFEASANVLNISPVQGLLLRMMDKIKRLNTFAESGELQVVGETELDAWKDLLNYAVLGCGLTLRQTGVSLKEYLDRKTVNPDPF